MESTYGEILRVDLSRERIKREKINEKIIRKYPGGKALGTYLITKEIPPGTEPFSERNKILFVPGSLSGLSPGASKIAVISLSPETRLINDSYAGDRFGPFLKRWGIGVLIIEGKSEKPVYLKIGENVEILDADKIWGKGVYEATEFLWKKHGDGAVAVIGIGGENLVRIANIIFDTERAAGRGGLGAVMGSKNLKGIYVDKISVEERKIKIADVERWKELKEKFYDKYGELALPSLKVYGTTNTLIYSGNRGMSPGFNFSRPYLPEELTKNLAGEEVKKYEVEPREFIHGHSCPIKCARYVKIKRGEKEFYVKPEYESIGMLGAATGVFNFPDVAYFNHLANDLGLDSIASGNVIGWLFEIVERGKIKKEEIGFKIHGFGDSAAEEKLLKMIANREGIGAILAEGVKKASEILNCGRDFAVHVKGLESPAWDPRGLRTYALSYATADVGASHMRGWPKNRSLPNDGAAKDEVPGLIEDRDNYALFDSLGLCMFVPYEFEDIERIFSTVMGVEGELKNLGWRVESIARIYNVLGGLNPVEDDTIPQRWWESEKEGPAKGNAAFQSEEDFKEALKEFYRLRGWNECGVPLPETMEILNAREFVNMAREVVKIMKRRCQ